MRNLSTLLFLGLVFMHFNCKNNNESSAETEDTSISDMIRNPISVDKVLDTAHVAKIVFDQKRVDFGTVSEGKIVSQYFAFENKGNVPLIISDIRTSCGCTTANIPEHPIEVGQRDSILVKFDTDGRPGSNSKAITIIANTVPTNHHLFLKGNVNKK